MEIEYNQLENDNNRLYKISLFVLPKASFSGILGLEFLNINDAVISIKDGTIELDRKLYEFPCSKTRTTNEIERSLLEKNKILTINDASNSEPRDQAIR